MTNYCNPGDTARVTLADGRVFEYTQNLPININCEEKYSDCTLLKVNYRYDRLSTSLVYQSTVNASVNCHVPITDIRVLNNSAVQIYCRGTSANGCVSANWFTVAQSGIFARFGNAQITSIEPLTNTPPPQNIFTIKDSLNNVLLSEVVNTCGYTVECLQGCPPNSLDCGDCCLSCDSVFNEISSIRALVKGLK